MTEVNPTIPSTQPVSAHPVRLILMLSLAPAIGLGIGRFAYSLVLPDMRDALHWSYSAAGFMNTVNAAGYLAGALAAAGLGRRFGAFAVMQAGSVASIVSLLVCGLTADFTLLSIARLLIGFGAAIAFVTGGALAATISLAYPSRSAYLLSLFYAGPGIGILLFGLIAPFLLQGFGAGSWWIVWLALGVVSVVMGCLCCASRRKRPTGSRTQLLRQSRSSPCGSTSRATFCSAPAISPT